MRLGCGPCAEEQAFLSRRKQVVAGALKQALQLDDDLREDEVCTGCIGSACSGAELNDCFLARVELGPGSCLPALLCFPLT